MESSSYDELVENLESRVEKAHRAVHAINRSQYEMIRRVLSEENQLNIVEEYVGLYPYEVADEVVDSSEPVSPDHLLFKDLVVKGLLSGIHLRVLLLLAEDVPKGLIAKSLNITTKNVNKVIHDVCKIIDGGELPPSLELVEEEVAFIANDQFCEVFNLYLSSFKFVGDLKKGDGGGRKSYKNVAMPNLKVYGTRRKEFEFFKSIRLGAECDSLKGLLEEDIEKMLSIYFDEEVVLRKGVRVDNSNEIKVFYWFDIASLDSVSKLT